MTSLGLQDLDGSSPLILDLSGLTFIDAAGTHALDDLACRVGKLVLVSPRPNVLRIFDIVWPKAPEGIEIRRPDSSRPVKTLHRSASLGASVAVERVMPHSAALRRRKRSKDSSERSAAVRIDSRKTHKTGKVIA